MESQLQRTHDHHLNEEDPRHHADLQSGETEHHHDHHGEKKSVLTKVKNKAKKIKDKIKQVGHANDNEGDDYDNDEDEETVDASDVHAAPMVNEPEFISGTALPKQTGANLENPTPLPKQTGVNLENPTALPKQTGVNLENPTAQPKHTGVNLENPTATGLPNMENPASPLEDRQSRTGRDDLGNVGAGTARDRDRHARDEMYSSIGNDKVIETSPLLDDPIPITNTNRKADYSGAGDVGEIMATEEEAPPTFDTKQRADVEDPTVRIGPLGGPEEDPHFPTTRVPDPSNYQTKLADPTGQGGVEVDVVDRLDNLHVGDESEYRKTEEPEEMDYTGSHDHIQKMDSEEMDYTEGHDHIQKMDSEDMDYIGSHHHIHKTDTEEMAFAGSHDPQPTPTSEPKSLDAESVPTVADKASSAKDMVASKLGYGHGQDDKVEESSTATQKGALESVSEYGHMVVEKLAPVYEKAAGAGSAIMSKMQRGGGEGEGAGTEGVVKESDKGVSVQEYLVEKFSPGEEDRELSKVISSAIRREGQPQPQVEAEAEVKERVTVEAVVSDEKAAPGVVDRVKGAIGSWLGKNPPGEGEGLEKEITSNLQE